LDLLVALCEQLARYLPASADADMALNNLERFVMAARSPLALAALLQRDPTALPPLLQIFATSQHLSDWLIVDPESYDLLRLSVGAPVAPQMLIDELSAEVAAIEHEQLVPRILRRFKRREMLRIAYGDIIRGQSLAVVTAQLSYLADAIVEAALQAARRKLAGQRGAPQSADGRPPRFVVLALGKLGGLELNYSSDIDLMFLYEGEGHTTGPRITTNAEYFELLARELVHLLTENTELGIAYRVDLRLRPEGQRGMMVPSLASALSYYDLRGRTWERQALIKARPIAGDIELGEEFLALLTPWIYRQYLSRAEIAEIRALKRRIEQRAHNRGADHRDVKTGRGGIRDVEFVIQFLQLLNGGDLAALRTSNTLEAIAQLGQVGCLSDLERTLLTENYSFLRKVEHRLQILFDLQTHLLPDSPDELRKLALRMGYTDVPGRPALDTFIADHQAKTLVNRRILDHLLHDAFPDSDQASDEADLVLDPEPPEARVSAVLGRYPFRDHRAAYRNLMALAEERSRFLSTRRCRHFLASIAPRLLSAIANTVDPDATLVNLSQVSDSLGGKGVLWELFSFNPPSLRLYVELCAYSPFLVNMLTSHPGMIDSLMDGLVLDTLPTAEFLEQTLAELCAGAVDLEPILHSFKSDQQLRVGVRNLLGREDIEATTRTLSDIAETCLRQIAARRYHRLLDKLGEPRLPTGRGRSRSCEMVILGLGKFGGREMSYLSDLDLIFLYEGEGQTKLAGGGVGTSNQHFFSELGQQIIKAASHIGPYGKLYDIDARLRPTGRSGALAISFAELERYFAEGRGQLWERQALCKARVVFGSERAAERARRIVARAVHAPSWRPEHAEEIRQMRRRLEQASAGSDLKRGPGGVVDVEFIVQMLQLRYGRKHPSLRTPNTLAGLRAAFDAGLLSADDYEHLFSGYRLLRRIEGRLQLLGSTARDHLPQDPVELAKLCHLLHYQSTEVLLHDFVNATAQIRARFDRLLDEAARP
jgi:glutamate-ammonia-ligase adenylyltransferase